MMWSLLVLVTVTSLATASSKKSRDKDDPILSNNFGEGLMEAYFENLQAAEDEDRRHPDFPPDPHSLPRENMKHILEELTNSEKDNIDVENMTEKLASLHSIRHSTRRRQKREIVQSNHRWKDGVVPYKWTDMLNEHDKNEIKRAMKLYEQFTCIRFVNYDDWKTDSDVYYKSGYIQFINEREGCCRVSGIGDVMHVNNVTCGNGSVCVHELGHVLGLVHEQTTSDPNQHWMMSSIFDSMYSYRTWPGASSLVGYDPTSFMHYPNWWNAWTFLYPEVQYGYLDKAQHFRDEMPEFYYPLKEVSLGYKCAERLCPYFQMTCENDGYLTQVHGRCTCVCVPGLDPATGCRTTISSTTKTIDFPGGSYALPKPEKSGCSIPSSKSGSVLLQSGSRPLLDVRGDFIDVSFKQEVCVVEDSESEDKWPVGNYCMYRKGGVCPYDFGEGFAAFQKDELESEDSFLEGALPDLENFNQTIRIEYCCRSDGFPFEPLVFPNRKAFTLLKHKKDQYNWGDVSDRQCPIVQGMHVYQRLYQLSHIVEVGGYNPLHHIRTQSSIKTWQDGPSTPPKPYYEMTLCQYKPAHIDCGSVYKLTKGEPSVTFSSNPESELECNWHITAPDNSQIKLNFGSFNIAGTMRGLDINHKRPVPYPMADDIPGQPGNCDDELEIRYFRPGQDGMVYCGDQMDMTIQSVYNTISLRLSTFGSSESSFTATASLISNDELCYNNTDRGTTYNGIVNFTRHFEPCLPWSETSQCRYSLFGNPGLTNAAAPLEGNFCRNPDYATGLLPWCYTKLSSLSDDLILCERNYCDPCLFGRKFDSGKNCKDKEEKGFCAASEQQPKSLIKCAKTCNLNLTTVESTSKTVCPTPTNVIDGTVVNVDANKVYSVGSKVTYKCNNTNVVKERVCLSSGQWSPMGFVCDVCSNGWNFDLPNSRCLKMFDNQEECTIHHGKVATAKSEQANTLFYDIAKGRDIWLPITDADVEGKWIWEDGDEVIFTKWDRDEPDNLESMAGYDQDCAVMRGGNSHWNDVGCSERFMYPVICSVSKADSQTCVDFLDTCSTLLASDPEMCEEHPEFALRSCSFTCGKCNAEFYPRCEVPKVPNGQHNTNESTVERGAVVTSACNEGYIAVFGDIERQCMLNGNLDREPLQCVKFDCPEPWVNSKVPEQCYKLLEGPMTHEQAIVACRNISGQLTMPNTDIEKAEVKEIVDLNKNTVVTWIGLKQNNVGDWIWTDGSYLLKEWGYYVNTVRETKCAITQGSHFGTLRCDVRSPILGAVCKVPMIEVYKISLQK